MWFKIQVLFSPILTCHITLSHIKEYEQPHSINYNTHLKIQQNWEFIKMLLIV